MNKFFLLLFVVFGLTFLHSCHEIIEEESLQEVHTLNQAAVPAEDEDVTQYIDQDEMFPKQEVTAELLAEVEKMYESYPAGDVTYRAHCTEVCDGLGNMPVFCETFDNREVGSVAQNSIYFEKWVPSAQNDGQIVSGLDGNLLRIDRRLQRPDANNEEDDILLLGTDNQGCYTLRFEMYIGNCRTAYFDLQKQLRTEILAAFTFNKFGRGVADLPNSGSTNFTYPVSQWFEVEIHFNVNNLPFNPTPPFNDIVIPNENTLTVSINGQQVAQVSTEESILNLNPTSHNNIQGVNFYPLFRSSKFYIDNICFAFLGDPAVDGGD